MPNPMQKSTPSKTPRTALITGASSGIGEATARALAREGYALALIARRKDRLDLLVKEIEQAGGRALAIAADLADDEATRLAACEAIQFLGRVDLLVNNAGYSPGAAIEQCSRQDLRHIFDVNLLSALQLIGAVTPQMRAQGGGRIINLGSVAGFVPAPLAIPYAATKVGLHAATDALRLELGRFGITLSLVIPGFVDTAVFDNARNASEALRALDAAVLVLSAVDGAKVGTERMCFSRRSSSACCRRAPSTGSCGASTSCRRHGQRRRRRSNERVSARAGQRGIAWANHRSPNGSTSIPNRSRYPLNAAFTSSASSEKSSRL